MMGMREAIGETEFEQQQILGYAPVEPDGSFKLQVPADTPLALAIIDAKGRAHPDAPELDPGAPRRAPHLRRLPQPAPRRVARTPARSSTRCRAALEASPSIGPPAGRDDGLDAHAPRPERAAAAGRHGVDRRLGRHGRRRRGARVDPEIRYTGNANAGRRPRDAGAGQRHHQLPRITSRRSGRATAAPTPASTATPTRPSSTCVRRSSGTGRVTSYEELLVGDPVIDTRTGLPADRGPREACRRSCAARRWSRRWRGNAGGMTRCEPPGRDHLRRER